MNTNGEVDGRESEFSSALKFLTILAQARETTEEVTRIFDKRFAIYTPDSKISIYNQALRRRDATGVRSQNREIGMAFVKSEPEFDLESLFKIVYSFYFRLIDKRYEVYCYIGLEVSRETPLGDPWILDINIFKFFEETLADVEFRTQEVSQIYLTHAQNFNVENPLEGTIYAMYYPRLKELFTNVQWNKTLETSSSHAHQQLDTEVWNKFADDVSTLRSELRAITKQAKESST